MLIQLGRDNTTISENFKKSRYFKMIQKKDQEFRGEQVASQIDKFKGMMKPKIKFKMDQRKIKPRLDEVENLRQFN